jgi:hypothetical protein
VRVLFETPITFDVVDRVVHSPMVHANVNGTMTKLILDTGSTDHVLTIELANRAALRSEPGESGTDHAGAAVPSWTLGEVPIQIESNALRLRNVVAIRAPARFEGWGVGGFLSPQNLHPSAFVVIDLVVDKLALVEGDTSTVSAWLRSRSPMLRLISLPRERGETVEVRASVEPFDSAVTMLNTGSSGTEFQRTAVPGLQGVPPESTGLGVSGAIVEGEDVTGQTLRVGDARFPLPVLFLRERMPPPHPPGQVGMDILRGTVLVVSADADRPILWMVPQRADVAAAP